MQVFESKQTFWYTPPPLTPAENEKMLKKYHGKNEIHKIRSPLLRELDEANHEIEPLHPDLREMVLDEYRDRFSTEWHLMCICSNPGQRSTEDSICGEDYTGRPMNELLDQFLDNPPHAKLDREYCYRWLVKFDRPPRMADIEFDLIIEFGKYSENITLPLVQQLKKPCMPNEVYRNGYGSIAFIYFYNYFVDTYRKTGLLDNLETKKKAFYDEVFKDLKLTRGPKAFDYSSDSEPDYSKIVKQMSTYRKWN